MDITFHSSGVGPISVSWFGAGSKLMPSVIKVDHTFFVNCHSLPSKFLHQYQIILLGDRGTSVQTTCLRLILRSILNGASQISGDLLLLR